MLSVISLFGKKALYVSEITESNTFLSWFAITFAITFITTSHKAIGLNSVNAVGFLFLGMRTILVALIFLMRTPVTKKFLIICTTSLPTTLQFSERRSGSCHRAMALYQDACEIQHLLLTFQSQHLVILYSVVLRQTLIYNSQKILLELVLQ